jgi:hypothetical protein
MQKEAAGSSRQEAAGRKQQPRAAITIRRRDRKR